MKPKNFIQTRHQLARFEWFACLLAFCMLFQTCSTFGACPPLSGSIAAGSYHTLALKSNGTVWGWGLNDFGQVGDGTTTDRLSPVQTSALNGVVAVAAGWYHSVALRSDGTVWTWGDNEDGAL